jgi:hypothetical protein
MAKAKKRTGNAGVPKKKRRGRPATGKAPLVSLRLATEIREEVTAWGVSRGLNRSQALRQLIEIGLTIGGRFS